MFFFNTHVDTAPPPPWKALSWVPGPGKCRHICLRVSHKARLKARNGHTHVYIYKITVLWVFNFNKCHQRFLKITPNLSLSHTHYKAHMFWIYYGVLHLKHLYCELIFPPKIKRFTLYIVLVLKYTWFKKLPKHPNINIRKTYYLVTENSFW